MKLLLQAEEFASSVEYLPAIELQLDDSLLDLFQQLEFDTMSLNFKAALISLNQMPDLKKWIN